MSFFGKKVGYFEGVAIYESPWLGKGYNSAGLALPGYGIILGIGVYSQNLDLYTVRHEFGHFLQAKQVGWVIFYLCIGLPSLMSAWLNWHGRGHHNYWTETWCNLLAKDYFDATDWPTRRFPCRPLSSATQYWLVKL